MENQEFLNQVLQQSRAAGLCKTQNDFAALLGVSFNSLSAALNGNKNYLTASLIRKAQEFAEKHLNPETAVEAPGTVTVIPTSARGGSIGDFSDSVAAYQCERIVSPIRGADYAIQITGDSMAPEYPSGSTVLIKKVDASMFIEWGKVYCLDTKNGAVIKKILNTEKEGVVRCESINPAFPPFDVKVDDVLHWYRVLMLLSLK